MQLQLAQARVDRHAVLSLSQDDPAAINRAPIKERRCERSGSGRGPRRAARTARDSLRSEHRDHGDWHVPFQPTRQTYTGTVWATESVRLGVIAATDCLDLLEQGSETLLTELDRCWHLEAPRGCAP
jgi:hypothetical protein